ncbi:MAG: hypothetical protein HLUCCO17_03680, partial [Saliniramus fredricksonii]
LRETARFGVSTQILRYFNGLRYIRQTSVHNAG